LAGKGTRITVDLGNEELLMALRIAAVEQRRSVRDIVVEALTDWLRQHDAPDTPASRAKNDSGSNPTQPPDEPGEQHEKDYVTMMETLNRYRGLNGKSTDTGAGR